MIVWVGYEGSEEASKIQKIALDPDKVRVGAKYFRCVKMTPEAAAQDSLMMETGDEVPRMVFISTDYDVVKVVAKKISGKTIYSGMQKTAKKCFKGNFDKNVKSMIKLLNEFDKIANERENLEKKEAKGLKKSEEKKVAKEKEELEQRQAEADERKAELLKVEPKVVS